MWPDIVERFAFAHEQTLLFFPGSFEPADLSDRAELDLILDPAINAGNLWVRQQASPYAITDDDVKMFCWNEQTAYQLLTEVFPDDSQARVSRAPITTADLGDVSTTLTGSDITTLPG